MATAQVEGRGVNNGVIPSTALTAHQMGTGTWAWGDSLVWGYSRQGKNGYNDADLRAAFDASINTGVTLFDTAELYGFGRSETLLGGFIRESGAQVEIATKFMPLPWRFVPTQLIAALHGSLRRLGLARVDLYQIHWPMPPVQPETWATALADALDMGLTRAVGVSNYNAMQTAQAHHTLARRGYPLTTNQVEYSLLNRKIERDGTFAAARERGVRIIAYSPLGMGLLTGKYTPQNPPPGGARRVTAQRLTDIQPLLAVMKTIGDAREKSQAQVALNWTICKDTLPIPGAKNVRQMEHNAGALGWRLSADEIAQLDEASESVAF